MRLSSTQLQHHRALWVKITTPLPQKPRIILPCSMVLGNAEGHHNCLPPSLQCPSPGMCPVRGNHSWMAFL